MPSPWPTARNICCPRAPRASTEGAAPEIEVTREALGGAEPWKRPLARADRRCAAVRHPTLRGRELHFPAPADELEAAGWSDLLDEARSGIDRLSGRRAARVADPGDDPDRRRRQPAAGRAGDRRRARGRSRAIRRHGIGGSIGIDLPTVDGKAARQAAADGGRRSSCPSRSSGPRSTASASCRSSGRAPTPRCSSWPPTAPPSKPAPCSAGRRVEVGAIRLVAHPAVIAVLEQRPDWLDRLARRSAAPSTLRADPSLAISAGHAEHRLRTCPLCGKPPVAGTRALLQPRLQGPRPAELARRGLSHPRAAGRSGRGLDSDEGDG